MPQQVFGAAAAVSMLNRAFNNASPGNAIFNNQVQQIGTTEESQILFANQFAAGFANVPAQELVEQVLGNMGLLPNDALVEAGVEALEAYGPGMYGAVVLSFAKLIATLENATGEQEIFRDAAAAWNNEVAQSYVYSSNPANTTPYNGDFPGTDTPSEGQTFTLTENVETVNGHATADNLFNAYTKFTVVGQVNTLQSGDVINGGSGNDTLVAESVAGAAGVTIAATINNVENLKLTSYGSTTIEGANITGLKSVTVQNSVAATTLQNLNEVVDLTVKNQTGNNDVTVGYTDTALQGNNVQKITLNNVTMKAAGGRVLFDDNNGAGTLEQLDIAVTGASNIAGIADAAGAANVLDGVTTVNVNATAAADLGTIGAAKMTTFDASQSTAGVRADVSGAAGNDLTIKGGEGDDFITFGSAANLNGKDSIDLGGGNNTLAITGSANGTSYNVKNVQTLQVTTDGNNTVNAQAFGAGVNNIGVVSAANGHDATINNLADGATVSARDAIGAVNTLAGLTVNGKNTSGTSDSVTVKLFSNDEGTSSTPSTFTVTTLTANGYENIKLVSEGKANTNNVITTLTANAQKSVSIEGDKKLTINNILNATTVDASASTGGVDLTVAGTGVAGGKQTVTGGTGNDTFRINSAVLSKDVKIDAGEGKDTLVFTDAAAIDFTTVANAEKLAGLSNFENLSFGGSSLKIDDATLNRFTDRVVNVVEKGAAATSLDASKVLNSSSKINVDASEMTVNGFTFSIGNGTDSFKGSAQADTVVVTQSVYLSDADVLNGGAGNNVLKFDMEGTGKQIVTAAQLANVSNFSTWEIANTDAAANDFSLTLTNAVAAQNVNNTNTLKIDAFASNGDTISLDASDVGSSYKIEYVANATKNTIKLGAGDDKITLGAGVDTVTLGGGKDTVVFTAVAANNTIKDINLGSGTTAVDQLDFKAFNILDADSVTGGFQTVVRTFSTGAPSAANVVVLSNVSYDTAAAVDTAVAAQTTLNGAVLVFWQDSLGRVMVGVDSDGATAGGAGEITTIATFEGVTITGVAGMLDAGDLILA